MNGTPLSLLVDTGAAVTLVQKETWDELHPNAKVTLKSWKEQRLVGVDGTPLRAYGAADIEITLGDRQFQTTFIPLVILRPRSLW